MNFTIKVESQEAILGLQAAAAERGLVAQDYLQQIVDEAVKDFIGQTPVTLDALVENLRVTKAELATLKAQMDATTKALNV